MRICLDTCFLIDLQRENKRGYGPATSCLESFSEAELLVSTISWGEFAEVRKENNREIFAEIRSGIRLIPVTETIAEHYSRIVATLRSSGILIATNDIWIAATALEEDAPLVTRNIRDFRRIAKLQLREY